MAATIHLVRHGTNDVLAHSIAGRSAGVGLNEEGRRQAEAAAAFLARQGISRIISSPLERAGQTAALLAALTGLAVEVRQAFIEVDFGDWTGKGLEDLDQLQLWKQWNTYRSGNRIPNGESMAEVQGRIVEGLERLRRESPDSTIAVFSHADPIRAALLYYLGMPLDFVLRLKIEPGSVSTMVLGDWGPQVLRVNYR